MTPLSDKEQVLELIRNIQALPPRPAVPDGLEGAERSLAGWLGRTGSLLQHPRVALFAGSHAGAADSRRAEAERTMQGIILGKAEIFHSAQLVDADLRLYELDMGLPRATDEATLVRAAAYGMMTVEPGVDIMVLGGFGGGIAESAMAFINALPRTGDPFGAMDSETMAALAGAIIAARLAGLPVILDGACAVAALLGLCRINRAMADHCVTSWQPPQAAREWFREHTALQFMPAKGLDEPGLEGVAILQTALSLKI